MKIYNKKKKRLFATIVLIVVLFNTILSSRYNNVKALELEEVNMTSSKKISNIFTYSGEKIENQYISYIESGIEYPIYKLNMEEQSLNNVNCKLESNSENSNVLWKILQYGYPYNSLENIGVSNEDEAYSVTQEAIYCLLNLRDITKYQSEKPENKVALEELINKVNGNSKTYNNSDIEIKETSGFHKENINGTIYYVQKFRLNSDSSINNYHVTISDAPEGTKILDLSDNETSNFETQFFKIAMPYKNIKEILDFKINANNILVNTFPLRYGTIDNNSYCITLNKSETVNDIQYRFNKQTNLSTINAKVIFKNGVVKPNTLIELKKNGELIASGNTDEKGIISFKELYPGRYSIYEKDINGEIIGDIPVTLDLLYSETVNVNVLNEVSSGSNIVIENEKKKGIIEINVSDLDNPNFMIANSEIDIFDSDSNFIEKMVTDENGIAMSSKLPIDKTYLLRQQTTLKDYMLDSELYKIEFKENDEIITIEMKNSIKKNFIKITKVDKDNNDIKLEGVVFGIYDSNNELIEEITTDSNGEAISSNFPINRPYYIKEIKTLDNYILDDKTITVFLTENTQPSNNTSDDIKEMKIDRLSNINNCLVLENQKIYNLLPKFGC